MTGYNNTGSEKFIQLFEQPTVTSGASVPTFKSLSCPANTWFDWFFDKGTSLSSLLYTVSTTPLVYTAPTAGQGLEISIELDSDFPVTAATTIAGDLATGVGSRQLWSVATGATSPKSLKALSITNNSGGTVYGWISARDLADISQSLSCHYGPILITDGETKNIPYGVGITPIEKVSTTVYKGCAVFFTDLPAYKSAIKGGTDEYVRGIYE